MLGKLSTEWATSSVLHLHILFLTFVVTQNILFYLTFIRPFIHSFVCSFIHSFIQRIAECHSKPGFELCAAV